jgi:hypothetical protein
MVACKWRAERNRNMAAKLASLGLAVAMSAASMLAACGVSPQTAIHNMTTSDPTKHYIGMSKSAIIACLGPPHARYASGDNSETLTYQYNGAGPTPGANAPASKAEKKANKQAGLAGGFKKQGSKDWTCTASLVFENDRLARLAYAHHDVRSPYAYMSVSDPKKKKELKDTPVPSCSFVLPPSCGR